VETERTPIDTVEPWGTAPQCEHDGGLSDEQRATVARNRAAALVRRLNAQLIRFQKNQTGRWTLRDSWAKSGMSAVELVQGGIPLKAQTA
jgi:hypothetical protein